ncbi:hypothetical protein BDB01DRAFT_96026 [Pilobolus umbonatus]|nr:hypothetical protein BDB01DRAFT_96026 [Pilobolus umbonatus]
MDIIGRFFIFQWSYLKGRVYLVCLFYTSALFCLTYTYIIIIRLYDACLTMIYLVCEFALICVFTQYIIDSVLSQIIPICCCFIKPF